MKTRPDYEIAREDLSALMVRERLDVVSTFVPFSQSRNKGGWPSLNWRVTLQRQGRDANTGERAGPVHQLIETDYMAGSAHCPAHKAKAREGALPREAARDKAHNVATECETGRKHMRVVFSQGPAILPDDVDVFSALLLDSDALDAGGFEDWAADYGYDTDSRAAEATYQACLETALKLRASLGEKLLTEARDLAARL